MTKQKINIPVCTLEKLHNKLQALDNNLDSQQKNRVYIIETRDLTHLKHAIDYLNRHGNTQGLVQYILTIPALSQSDEDEIKKFSFALKDKARTTLEGALRLKVRSPSSVLDISVKAVRKTLTPSTSPANVPELAKPSTGSLTQHSVFSDVSTSDKPKNSLELPDSQESWEPSQSSQDTWDPSQNSSQDF